MSSVGRFLKPNLVFEPLVNQWYAWPHLISPATHARNITGRHLKIMSSYIQAPQIHAAAVANPKMRGGPFMDLAGGRADEVEALRARTREQQADLLELSEAIQELEDMVRREARGGSLHPLYEKVPKLLQGYVELLYDLNGHPSWRFFESLLYEHFYDPSDQSLAFWLTSDDERPFVLSTPRLEEDEVIQVRIPFADAAIDSLAKMRLEPGDVAAVAEALAIPAEKRALFDTFFTEEAPAPYRAYDGDRIRMRYLGHACILLETRDVSILVDPLVSYYGYDQEIPRFTYADLPARIDYVLVTHNHQDHILFETLLPLRHRIGQIVVPRTNSGALQDPNLRLMLNHVGFDNVVELDEMDTLRFEDCSITGLPCLGEHGDLNIRTKLCYHIEVAGFSAMLAADSCNIEPRVYEHVQRVVGDIDVIFLGMECDGAPLSWLYGPLLSQELPREQDQTRRLNGSNYERGMALVDVFHPKEVYVYAMGMEPWLEFISSIKYTAESHPIVASGQLVEECTRRGLVAERLYGEKELFYDRSPQQIPERSIKEIAV